MKEYLKRLPENILGLIESCQEVAETLNYNTYLVGGFVRDLFLNVDNFDLDIAVVGEGIKFAEVLAQKLNGKIVSHKKFGTATVTVKHHLKIDVATARKEYYPHPGSLPVVNKGEIKDDLSRRDFTINTLVISLKRENFGQLLDLFGGKSDIMHRRIRILHPLSFIDDPTRLLRAVRFEQRYDFKIDLDTLKSFQEAVDLKMLFMVEPQRLRDELILILKENRPLKVLKRLEELSGLGFISPGLRLSGKTERLLENVFVQVKWFKGIFSSHRHIDSWLMYLAGIMEGLDLERVHAVCNRFVFRKGEEKRLLDFFRLREKLILKLSRPELKPSRVFHLLEPLSYEVILLLKASVKNKWALEYINNFLHVYNGTGIVLKGHDLNGLGFVPGPHYQKIFRMILNAKLNGQIKTAQEELEFVKKLKKRGTVSISHSKGMSSIEKKEK